MKRREFMKASATALGLFATGGATAGFPSLAYAKTSGPVTPLDTLLEQGMRVMWVGAHPDDESMVGAMLAKAGPRLGNPLYFLVLTRGDGGECLLPGGCSPDLGTVRANEMKEVARLYGAELQHEYYWNAPLPVESFPKRHEIAERWVREHGDPTFVIAKAIRDFKPDVLLTFAPINGFTGHPEHQLASRFSTAAIRVAADPNSGLPGAAHRVEYSYYGLNRYWPYRLFGAGDPMEPTETFRGRQECIDGKTCLEILAEYTKPHRTQENDMGAVRVLSRYLITFYLRRTDPFTEVFDPHEKVVENGMG
ncbi:MAG: PIG-L family deacetylase [Candidatus Lernaella stagnicola]|nr:PIG-L family deacetylase [Candidatus Lernaella stagnicola]